MMTEMSYVTIEPQPPRQGCRHRVLVVLVYVALFCVGGGLWCHRCIESTKDWQQRGEEYPAEVPFGLDGDQTDAMCPNWPPGATDVYLVTADPGVLRFRRRGESLPTTARATLTSVKLGKVCSGEFSMRGTLTHQSPTGPGGYSETLVVKLDQIRLTRRFEPPAAPSGWQGIVPNQFVVRPISGAYSDVDDRYLVELPARSKAALSLGPYCDRLAWTPTVMKDGVPLRLKYEPGGRAPGYRFETTGAGLYEVRVSLGGNRAPRSRKYTLSVWHGDVLGGGGDTKFDFLDPLCRDQDGGTR